MKPLAWLTTALLCTACNTAPTSVAIDAEPPPVKAHEVDLPVAAPPVNTVPEPTLGMATGFVVLGPDRAVPIEVEHAPNARLRLLMLREAELSRVRPFLGEHRAGHDPLAELPTALATRLKVLPVDAKQRSVDVFASVGGQFVLAALDAPGARARVALFQRAELSVLLKVGGESGLVWVTSTRTGAPVANAAVTLRQGSRPRFFGHTDAAGLLRLPAEHRLRLARDDGSDNAEFSQPLDVVAQRGKDIVFASETWSTGVDPWSFGLPEVYYRGQDALRGSVTAERGIYRPGDRVHVLGVLRLRLANGKLAAPTGKVALLVNDADGNAVHQERIALSEFGTFRSEFPIATSARLGRYSVVVTKDSAELRGRFEVGEYRPVRFEVNVAAANVTPQGDTLSFPVSAGYLYGSPVADAQVTYTVSGRSKSAFGWSNGYSYGPSQPCDDYCNESASSNLIELSRGEVTLDARGQAQIPVAVSSLVHDDLTRSQALDLVVEASVTDAAGDVVTGRALHTWSPNRALVGLFSDAWVVTPQQGFPLKLQVSDLNGKPRAGEAVVLQLVRRKWVGVASDHSDERRYQGGWEDEVVATQQAVSTAAPLAVLFPLTAGGEYRVDASLAGATPVASVAVWAYGGDAYGAWDNHARMKLRTDRDDYRPGQRARIYAEIPYEKSWGLITLEREGVLEARVSEFSGSGTPIEVDLDERRLPNVFASVAVVPSGLSTASPAAGPPLRIGYTELRVSAEERRLRVQVKPVTPRARPGEQVELAVDVTDQAGKPVRAEVTLWVADEGVLKLTGYATPDPFLPAYERHSHFVRTSASLLRWVNGSSDAWDEYGGDSAPGPNGAALRSRFLSTAFFSKGIVTDRFGRARVTVGLPDNLTRWRVMAVAADSGERFGSGEASVEASQPLQIEPVLPRFLTRGDEFEASVLVHNRSGAAGVANVRFGVNGATLLGPATAQLSLAAGARAQLGFRVRADEIGTAKFKVGVSLGTEHDGFALGIPVHAATSWQTTLLGEGRIGDARSIAFELPSTAEPGLAEVVVNVAPGVLASIGSSLDALIDYPNGCVEQTTSRLIPMLLLERILRSSGDPRLSGPEHHGKMEQAVRHVLKHQNADGGFGLWPNSASEGFLTAYALWGLFTAQKHHYTVPASSLREGLAYLTAHANQGDDMHGQFSPQETRPFAAYVLAFAKQGDAGLSQTLLRDQKALSRFGLGLLGAAVASRESNAASEVLRELALAKVKTRAGARIVEPKADADVFGAGRDLRASAIAVRALALAGKARQAEDLISGILEQRRPDGSWGTTYNNLWALHALSDYANASRTATNDERVRIQLDSAELPAIALGAAATYRSLTIASKDLPLPGKSSKLTLSTGSDSELRFTARLRFANRVSEQKAIDRGFSVTRKIVDASSGAEVSQPARGQLLRVLVQLVTQSPREQVALTDRLPAGFEPVDTALATSARDPGAAARGDSVWNYRELHDERVTHFADSLPAGTHVAEYLVRATRSGTFHRPAASAEMMYAPDVFGQSAIETVTVR